MSGLRIGRPGLFTTVQDAGRPGYRAFGVPVAGAFDRGSLALANALAGNGPNEAALELTRLGPSLEAGGPVYLAIAGPLVDAEIVPVHGPPRRVATPGAFPLEAGERLILGEIAFGCRSYLAVHGGFLFPTVLGSRSTEAPLLAGDQLPSRTATGPVVRLNRDWGLTRTDELMTIRCLEGPDATAVPPAAWSGRTFRIGRECSRMGLALVEESMGPVSERPVESSRMSAPVAPGALQWTGQRWLLLGVAGGTMGGYPHAAQVLTADLDRVAQGVPGQWLEFVRVSRSEALGIEQTYRDRVARRSQVVRSRMLAEIRPGSERIGE
jgi:allophanate hydrolase subunit 2